MASKNEDFFKDVFESLEDDQTGGEAKATHFAGPPLGSPKAPVFKTHTSKQKTGKGQSA